MFAPRHFRAPPATVDAAQAVCRAVKFIVNDWNTGVAARVQAAGAAQVCPLSPYLVIIVMPVLLDAVERELE
eukprot:5929431-Pyramimonas_sp.AAC.1